MERRPRNTRLILGFITIVAIIAVVVMKVVNDDGRPTHGPGHTNAPDPGKVLAVAYPSPVNTRKQFQTALKYCGLGSCTGHALVLTEHGHEYDYAFDDFYSGRTALISPNGAYAYLPIDKVPLRFTEGKAQRFRKPLTEVKQDFAVLLDDGTLIQSAYRQQGGAIANLIDTHPISGASTSIPGLDSRLFNCDGRVFSLGDTQDRDEGQQIEWETFELDRNTGALQPLPHLFRLRATYERLIHHRCLNDGSGTIEFVSFLSTAFSKANDEYAIIRWHPEAGMVGEPTVVQTDTGAATAIMVADDQLIIANGEGQVSVFARDTASHVLRWDVQRVHPAISSDFSTIQFADGRAFVFAKYPVGAQPGPDDLAWIGAEVDPATGAVVQRVALPFFESAYPYTRTLSNILITDGKLFSDWLSRQPRISE